MAEILPLTQDFALHAQLAAGNVQMYSPQELQPYQAAEVRKMWHHAVSRDTNAIGFLPTSVFTMRFAKGDFSTVYNNADLVGWAMHALSQKRGVMKLYQIWVRPDARLILHGKALIAKVEQHAQKARSTLIEAWVAEDLPANFFWKAIGFVNTNWRWGRGENPRKHLRWVRRVFAENVRIENGRS